MQHSGTDRRTYLAQLAALNRELAAIEACDGHLLNVIERLFEHQLDTGFIRDDLYAVEHVDFPHPRDPSRFLSAQYNPARLQRLTLRDDALPPGRTDAVNDGCLLCSRNIEWQHQGREMGYMIQLNRGAFTILMNPYPLMPMHTVVATNSHIPQAWQLGNSARGQISIEALIDNLAALAGRLPGYVGFYNGEGAGATVPEHFHYQFFRRRNGSDRFPLELAPVEQVADLVAEVRDYPVSAMRWLGQDRHEVIKRATIWITDWLRANLGQRPGLTGNLFAMTDSSGYLQLYFVPRDSGRARGSHASSTIGSLEILGELVLTSDRDKHELDWGKINYQSIARILADISISL